MQHLGLLFTLLLIFINLWGIALVTGWIWRNRWLAGALGPWLLTTLFYTFESYHGLGSLRGVGFIGSITSLALILLSGSAWSPVCLGATGARRLQEWRAEFSPRKMLDCGIVFGAVFGYAMLWRFAYPNVDGSSEKLADFSYICSYLSGQTIPVPDAWLHPYPSNQYYSFQHYAAALMGRLLGLSPGTVYNLGFCVLIGLGGLTFAGVIWLVCRRLWVRIVLLVGLVIGGSGMSGVIHLVDKNPTPWSSMRFIGSAPLDRAPLGVMLKAYQDRFPKLDLPGEPFSYSIFLGDYHAPLASYLLLGLVAMSVILWHREPLRRHLLVVGATLTWTVLANTWSLPLQALMIAGWLAYLGRRSPRALLWTGAGAAGVWMAAWVYLSAFTTAAGGYGTAIRLVRWDEHTPPLLLLLFLLPSLGFILMGYLSGVRAGRWLAHLWILMVVFSEFFFVDDIYSGNFNRFNTTLKWWPWIAAGILVTLGPIVLDRSQRRWVRFSGLFLCLYPCSFAWDLAVNWKNGSKEAMGKMEGHAFLTKDMFPRLMLNRLQQEKRGVVIERPNKDAFTNSACLPLFAGHSLWLGWLNHEQLWRGYREDLPQRQAALFKFFNGEMAKPREWLLANDIDYVLWYQEQDTLALWQKINAGMGPDYLWVEIFAHDFDNGPKAGFWRRVRTGPDAGQ
ncbi:MAG: hypothetical protein KBA71_14020 [Opitutaceae bacterium]|nr:hypothetical protein [Opitutaceae bacterium]